MMLYILFKNSQKYIRLMKLKMNSMSLKILYSLSGVLKTLVKSRQFKLK